MQQEIYFKCQIETKAHKQIGIPAEEYEFMIDAFVLDNEELMFHALQGISVIMERDLIQSITLHVVDVETNTIIDGATVTNFSDLFRILKIWQNKDYQFEFDHEEFKPEIKENVD